MKITKIKVVNQYSNKAIAKSYFSMKFKWGQTNLFCINNYF